MRYSAASLRPIKDAHASGLRLNIGKLIPRWKGVTIGGDVHLATYREKAMIRQLLFALLIGSFLSSVSNAEPRKFARYRVGNKIAYGIVDGERIQEIEGNLFYQWKKTDRSYALKEVKLLVPSEPRHVFAMAGNYENHINDGTTTAIITTTSKVSSNPKTGETTTETKVEEEVRIAGQVPELFKTPQPFFKSPSSLTANDTNVVIPKDAGVVHYEAELVIVIGRTCKDVSKQEAADYVFGVTCGNDVSARVWQKGDVQWWRAKASDTFGPCGPFIVTGLDYDNLKITLRQNGEVKQDDNTKHLIHDVASCVSFISKHITLQPGDMIFTGTPGKTAEIKAGDVLEVEIEGVGVLRNKVVAE
ncbi:MAG: fumarylacetoacetate hydrolase [Planctomycetaceae bacterium]|nr:fumarylacetoacetate hydrolase [Planctomycetaceae bacterium]